MDLLGSDLDAVDWARLCGGPEYFAGAAADVPELLRGLASAAGPADASEWGERLYDVAHHSHSGGYLWPAELMTPFLVMISESGRPASQAVALLFLAHLGGGVPSSAETCARSAGLRERTMTAVRAGFHCYYARLEAPDPLVRAAAFVLLSVLEHAPIRDLSGPERAALPAGVPSTSDRFRQARDQLTATEADTIVLGRIREAEIDPLFGCGEAYFGIEFEL